MATEQDTLFIIDYDGVLDRQTSLEINPGYYLKTVVQVFDSTITGSLRNIAVDYSICRGLYKSEGSLMEDDTFSTLVGARKRKVSRFPQLFVT